MSGVAKRESRRLEIQCELDAQKTSAERNRMGQFATPTALANEILSYGLSLIDTEGDIRFLDPAIGTGSFFSALLTVGQSSRIKQAIGYEIDPHYGAPAQELWGDTILKIRMDDFTHAKPTTDDLSNLLICNPPYVRHHHIEQSIKAGLQTRTQQACDVSIGGLAGLYCYFMGLAHRWMEPNAVAGWLVPSEFMDVNYGKKIKEYLLSKVQLLHIHRFDPADVQFSDALVSSAVVWFRNSHPKTQHTVKFTFGGTLSEPTISRDVTATELKGEMKWTRYPMANKPSKRAAVTLDDLFSIKRGIATGDNSFFIMNREQIAERNLPMECFTPVLPSTRYISGDEIAADSEGFPKIARQQFLLDTKLPEPTIKERFPSLWQYLQTGREGDKPVSDRYLCRTKKLWYAQEKRPPAPIICTYMGRPRNGAKPFRFILNHSKATACNVYLLLYPKPAFAALIKREPTVLRTVWKFLNQIDADELIGNGRVYGGGLHKLEPKELRNVSIDQLVREVSILASFVSEQADFFSVEAA